MNAKRFIALLLGLAMLLSMAACSGKDGLSVSDNITSDYNNIVQDNDVPPATQPADDLPMDQSNAATANTAVLSGQDLRYVMIYNPNVYDETVFFDGSSLSTGSIGSQVDVDAFKAGGLQEEPQLLFMTPDDIGPGMSELTLEGGRGSTLEYSYKQGDQHTFYCFNAYSMSNREQQTFTCRYVGQYCNIWTYNSNLSDSQIVNYGQEFDAVYHVLVETFGQPRFTDSVGKINMLYYPMQDGIAGCFYSGDLFAADEVTPTELTAYGINTNHAILNLNSVYAEIPDFVPCMAATQAHELQHLINFTNALEAGLTMRTWLNEAMSGYIEELLYPGTKENPIYGHLDAFSSSNLIRHGQSMYNFTTDMYDIGVYGSVYLFSEYLANLAGGNVFSNIHTYWKDSYSMTLSEAEAMACSVPEEVYQQIDSFITYPDSVVFNSEEEEWMSKLVLHFYLSMLTADETDPAAYTKIDPATLLYDEINAAQIEGGGRVIIALSGSTFAIPGDAEQGLIYVGLDSNFQPVTSIVYA